jgi:hypothetical protein
MPYIKISDPNTIDLASWQQVVNVVNQHSDSINAITNNFGAQSTGDNSWDTTEDFAYEYDPASQKMLYGRTRIDPATIDKEDDYVHYQEIEFAQNGTSDFSARPIVTATGRFGSTEPTSDNNADIMVTVIAVTKESFFIRIVNARSRKTTSTGALTVQALDNFPFYINWVAVGPK